MFCAKCGKEIPDTAKFCSGCGFQVLKNENSTYSGREADANSSNSVSSMQGNEGAGYPHVAATASGSVAVPSRASTLSPGAIVAIIAGGATLAIVSVIVITVIMINAGHDMTGTYYTDKDFFLIDWITFSTDGTFRTSGGSYVLSLDTYGKYSKRGSRYHLVYTYDDGHISPVGYEMDVEVVSDNHIIVYIIPKGGGYAAWYGSKADFYSY